MNAEPIKDMRPAQAVTAAIAISTLDACTMAKVLSGMAGVELAGRYVERTRERDLGQEGNAPVP